VTNANNT